MVETLDAGGGRNIGRLTQDQTRTQRIANAHQRIKDLKPGHPHFELYFVPDNRVEERINRFADLGQYLERRPSFLDALNTAHDNAGSDETITMLVEPNAPFVLARYRRITAAVVPITTCTQEAIDKLGVPPEEDGYFIVTSDTRLMDKTAVDAEPRAWTGAKRNLWFAIYHPDAPKEHLARSVQGAIINEPLRMVYPPSPDNRFIFKELLPETLP